MLCPQIFVLLYSVKLSSITVCRCQSLSLPLKPPLLSHQCILFMPRSSRKPARDGDADTAVKPISPMLDLVLRLGLLASLFRQLYYCYTSYDTNPDQLFYFVSFFALTCLCIAVSKRVFNAFGKRVSSLKPDNPLKDPSTMTKFEDQGWQWTIHVCMTICEVYLVSYGDGRMWLMNYKSIGCPGEYDVPKEIELFVLLQLSIWLVTGLSCTYLECRRKDYVEMMLHHVLTNVLIGTAIVNEEHAFALLILLVHDSSDILVDTLKLSNYLKLEGSKYCYFSEICFVTLVYGVWPYARMWTYPMIVLQGEFEGYQEKCSSLNNGVATYDLHKVESWIYIRCFLCMLLCSLHWFWWILFNRITYSIIKGGKKGSEAGDDEYEGENTKKK